MSYPKWLGSHLHDFYDLGEPDLLSRCIYGEAAGEPMEGKFAVACVVRNRVLTPGWWGNTYKRVILSPSQFSCFNYDSGLLEKMMMKKPVRSWADCDSAAMDVIVRNLPDITGGATHYFNPDVCDIPPWAHRMVRTCVIGKHHFYNEFGVG